MEDWRWNPRGPHVRIRPGVPGSHTSMPSLNVCGAPRIGGLFHGWPCRESAALTEARIVWKCGQPCMHAFSLVCYGGWHQHSMLASIRSLKPPRSAAVNSDETPQRTNGSKRGQRTQQHARCMRQPFRCRHTVSEPFRFQAPNHAWMVIIEHDVNITLLL